MSNVIFDDAGYAVHAGYVRVYHFKSNGEYCGWSDEYISVGLGLPGKSTMIAAGEPVAGQVWIFDGSQWLASEDHRGETVYSISDSRAVIIDYIGPIAEGYVTKSPATEFDKWNGSEWVTDSDAQKVAAVNAAAIAKAQLRAAASDEIEWRQDAVNAGIATEEEAAALAEWITYRVLLMRVDTTKPVWPTPPVTQAS